MSHVCRRSWRGSHWRRSGGTGHRELRARYHHQILDDHGPNGTYAGITAPNPGNGITINAPGAIVRLRGLNIESNQPPVVGLTTLPANGIGIDIVAAASVSVENCAIAGFPYIGIAALALSNSTQSTPLQLNVIDSVFVQDGSSAALFLAPNNVAGGATVTATVHNVSFNGVGNYVGNGNEALAVGAGASLAIDNSQIVGYMFGVFVFANSGQAYMVATNNVWNNGAYNVSVGGGSGSNIADLRSNLLTGTSTTNPAIVSAWSAYGLAGSQTSDAAVFVGSTGAVSLDANTISGNSVGVNHVGGSATASSFGNNQFISNGTDVTGTLSSVATK